MGVEQKKGRIKMFGSVSFQIRKVGIKKNLWRLAADARTCSFWCFHQRWVAGIIR